MFNDILWEWPYSLPNAVSFKSVPTRMALNDLQCRLLLKGEGKRFLHGDLVNNLNKYCTLQRRRQSRGSSDSSDNEEEVPTGRGSFSQPYAFQPTAASVNYHDDADSARDYWVRRWVPGSRIGRPIGHKELISRQTVKTYVHITRSHGSVRVFLPRDAL